MVWVVCGCERGVVCVVWVGGVWCERWVVWGCEREVVRVVWRCEMGVRWWGCERGNL